jgi:hypothetical protein
MSFTPLPENNMVVSTQLFGFNKVYHIKNTFGYRPCC